MINVSFGTFAHLEGSIEITDYNYIRVFLNSEIRTQQR